MHDGLIIKVRNAWQSTVRPSINIGGRLAVWRQSRLHLIAVEPGPCKASHADAPRAGSKSARHASAAQQLIGLFRQCPDAREFAVRCEAVSSDFAMFVGLAVSRHDHEYIRTEWVARAVRRYARHLSELQTALFTGDIDGAVRLLAAAGKPWLACMLAAGCPQPLALQQLAKGGDAVDVMVCSVLAGRPAAVFEQLAADEPVWLLRFALQCLYSGPDGSTAQPDGAVVGRSFPNGLAIHDAAYCIVAGRAVHSASFCSYFDNDRCDLALPFVINTLMGLPADHVQLAEQLSFSGDVDAACWLLRQQPGMLLSVASRHMHSCALLSHQQQSLMHAWRWARDHEAAFDAFAQAGDMQQAERVFVDHLADGYVLSGERGRLAARLAVLLPVVPGNDRLLLYQHYALLAEAGGAVETARARAIVHILSTLADPGGSLAKRIAFSEMAAACAVCLQDEPCTGEVAFLPPELLLMHCHRLLQ